MQRNILQNISDQAWVKQTKFHDDVLEFVQSAITNHNVVVIGMSQNPVCKSACKNLSNAQVEFTYLSYGSYLSKWKQRLAIKMWSGWPTFPQVFINGQLIGGNAELVKLLDSNSPLLQPKQK